MERRSIHVVAADGLRLHASLWSPPHDAGCLPVVCLPGLTRSAADFEPLAIALASRTGGRRVLGIDYRGRGLSDHDPDWRHYDLATERRDFLQTLVECGISRAHFVGTSRGGLHLMAMAATHRDLIAGVVLNDIGPVLEPAGLLRIKSYIGRAAAPASLDEAVRLMKFSEVAAGFRRLDAAGWRHFASTTFGANEDDLRLRYDPALARTLDAFDLSRPLPELWDGFDALAPAPVLAIRAENSDLLSPETLDAMVRRRSGVRAHVVAGQAHAPLLADGPTIDAIAGFLDEADAVT